MGSLLEEYAQKQLPLGDELRAVSAECREKAVEQAQLQFEEQKTKKKTKKGAEEEFDAAKVPFKIPDELVLRILQHKLSQQKCLTRGFVLDSFCKSLDFIQNVYAGEILIQTG